MKVVAAYLLAVLGGNSSPSAADINKILSSVGAEADSAQVEKLLGELKGKDVNQVIAEGKTKLAAVPTGGAASAAPASGSAPAAAAKKEEPKKEEKKQESESEGDMGFGLFG